MGIEFKETTAYLVGTVSAEEAETLLGWLQREKNASVDLSGCTHLHTANLQVLMAAQPNITIWPQDQELAFWLKNVLEKKMI